MPMQGVVSRVLPDCPQLQPTRSRLFALSNLFSSPIPSNLGASLGTGAGAGAGLGVGQGRAGQGVLFTVDTPCLPGMEGGPVLQAKLTQCTLTAAAPSGSTMSGSSDPPGRIHGPAGCHQGQNDSAGARGHMHGTTEFHQGRNNSAARCIILGVLALPLSRDDGMQIQVRRSPSWDVSLYMSLSWPHQQGHYHHGPTPVCSFSPSLFLFSLSHCQSPGHNPLATTPPWLLQAVRWQAAAEQALSAPEPVPTAKATAQTVHGPAAVGAPAHRPGQDPSFPSQAKKTQRDLGTSKGSC